MFTFTPQVSVLVMALLLAPPLAAPALAGDPPAKTSAAQAPNAAANSVVVGAFNVGFIFQSVDKTAATGGLIGAFGDVTNAKSELVGVTPAMMQTVADGAYADFKAQLTAKGFTVVDPATMFASEAFAKVKPMPSPVQASVYIDKKSTGKTVYYKPTAIPGQVMLPGDVVGSGLSSIGMQSSWGYTYYGMAQHAKATGQSVIDVVYLIDFSNAKRNGGIKITSGMSVAGGFSRLSVFSPSGKSSALKLKDAVAVEGDYADMKDATKDAGLQKAMNVFGGLAAAGGMGGLKFGKSRTYTFTAKPGVYEEGAIKVASLANTRMIEQLVGMR